MNLIRNLGACDALVLAGVLIRANAQENYPIRELNSGTDAGKARIDAMLHAGCRHEGVYMSCPRFRLGGR